MIQRKHMEQYHGTNTKAAADISNGRMNVNLGGGELGKGFYTGDLLWKAFAWAWHIYQKKKAVVKFIIDDDDFLKLKPFCPDKFTTYRYRKMIRERGETRTFVFNRNAIWAPVVGKHCHNFNQIKYESKQAENLLNGTTVTKTIL